MRLSSTTSNRNSHRAGIAIVETAILLLPLFIFTLFGVWEVGRLLQTHQIVSNAAREGARQASTGQRTSTGSASLHPELPFNGDFEVQKSVENYLRNAGLPLNDPVTSNPIYTVRVQNVSKSLTSDYPTNTPPAADPVSSSVQDINNGADVLLVTVTYPYSMVKWSPGQFFVPANRMITVTTKWYSLKDIPIVVDTSIPAAPIP
ncbi:MAG TPA: pilus assembly protein [Gemmatales bacterium]|nr:pilus assembly protein [Gemmatales bacterium]